MSSRPQPMAWSEAVRDPDGSLRGPFIEAHVDLVRYLALRIAGRLPAGVDIDDLIHDGIVGLIDAVDRFDPGRKVLFRTYAETRVRGAILDGLRRRDWRPRSVRSRRRDVDSTLMELESHLGRAASEDEAAAAMGLPIDEYHALLLEITSGPLLSLDEMQDADDLAPDRHATRPDDSLEQQEKIDALVEQIGDLPERERRVLALYYVDGLNMKEVGEVLGVTESRVCQLHGQAAARLRAGLRARLKAPALTAIRRLW